MAQKHFELHSKVKLSVVFVVLGLAFSAGFMACGPKNEKKVYFGNLENNAQVESPFKVIMKAENLIVEPASMGVRDGAGHFHILINQPLSTSGTPIPKDADHIHYGAGQTETTLDLPVGDHTLVLEFAKGDHIPYDPAIAQQIRITVTKQNVIVPESTTIVDSSKAMLDSNAVMADSTLKDSVKTETKAQ